MPQRSIVQTIRNDHGGTDRCGPADRRAAFADSAYRNAERILIYASYRDEVPTYEIMEQAWRDGKQVFCPKIEDSPEPETTAGGKKKTMTFYRVFCRMNW